MAIRVRATKLGFFRGRRRVGAEFSIDDKKQLGSWMEVIDDNYPDEKADQSQDSGASDKDKATGKTGKAPAGGK